MYALRSIRAPLVRAARFTAPTARFSACATRFGGHHEVKVQQGPGAAPGATPTDLDQSTGLERAELLGKMQGKDIFDLAPLEVLVRGTKTNPTIIRSRDPVRYVGCTGVPGEHHETNWLVIDETHEFDRCDQCGNVYKWAEYPADENFPAKTGHGHHH
ncbi:Cytochrome c oxidase subunit 4 [Podila verticillata]|nr:Cytochrome c oxidase subunit 4 [Podila verticillata]KAF9378213.1 Cytochrome c oxidase subunit 4 [Podila verticillata]KAF9385596.1 Cytochrome c oxidase subunit 4 [Podila verticillata]KAI9241420.1 MAG: cytochrome c oxidase subunit VB-domain-containing protein [Podila humilis]KFH70191.1 cytochrome c oxidase subunit Vb [Podila verticillata NRRL 6337]